MDGSTNVSTLLACIREGTPGAVAQLVPIVYDELRHLAGYFLRGQASGNTLQPTALVHETYMRLANGQPLDCRDRAHFMAIAAQSMRRILVDHARAQSTAKRGGPRQKVSLQDAMAMANENSEHFLAVDQLMSRFAELDPKRARIFDLWFTLGMTVDEVAATLSITSGTVRSGLAVARAWLRRELGAQSS